jgi:glycosyltransferase involved in cell wall biosynthesis
MRLVRPDFSPPPPAAPQGAIRVLHVRTVRGNGGGPEKTVFRSGEYFHRFGVAPEALYLLDAHTPSDLLIQRAARSSIPVHFAVERSAMDVAGVGALARLVRSGRFDILHAHDYKANALARLLWPAGGYRIIATAHGYNRTTRREACYYALEKLLLRSVDAVICPSRNLADQLARSGVSRSRLHLVPNAIAIEDWPYQPRRSRGETLRVLYVGRLSPEKNVPALLEAGAHLRRNGLALVIEIAGEGPQRGELEAQAAQLGLTEAVSFLGLRDDVAEVMARCDLFVNPSLTEGMPNTVLEALSSGLPVIATDVGATCELVVHEQTGLLVPPADVPALAAAIARLAQTPDLAQYLALRGRRHVEDQFSLLSRTALIVALYRGVLAAARRSA